MQTSAEEEHQPMSAISLEHSPINNAKPASKRAPLFFQTANAAIHRAQNEQPGR